MTAAITPVFPQLATAPRFLGTSGNWRSSRSKVRSTAGLVGRTRSTATSSPRPHSMSPVDGRPPILMTAV